MPPVYSFPDGADDVVAQISIGVPTGPPVPLLTVYGDGVMIAGTRDGWRTGRVSAFAIQELLDDAESVGLLDEPLVQRRADVLTPATTTGDGGLDGSADRGTAPDPDITIRLDVDGRVLVHELDLQRIERPPGIRAFVSAATVENRFGLTEEFDPGAWIDCSASACDIVTEPVDPDSRPVLPHEDPDALLVP